MVLGDKQDAQIIHGQGYPVTIKDDLLDFSELIEIQAIDQPNTIAIGKADEHIIPIPGNPGEGGVSGRKSANIQHVGAEKPAIINGVNPIAHIKDVSVRPITADEIIIPQAGLHVVRSRTAKNAIITRCLVCDNDCRLHRGLIEGYTISGKENFLHIIGAS